LKVYTFKKAKDTDLIFSRERKGYYFWGETYFLFGTGMSILPELLAQIVAISFCFHVKKIKDTSVELD
jgi:hypothetical protein